MLESMSPLAEAAAQSGAAPRRSVFICTALGLLPQSLWPKTPGQNYESTEYLNLLQQHRSDFTLYSGLAHEGQAGRQPHNCEMTWLTSARGPGLDGFKNSISVDQYAASKLGYTTRFPSITLGSNSPQSQSFTSSGVMIPAETSPANMFAKLFLTGNPQEVANQKRRLQDGRSILDQLIDQTNSIKQSTSSADNHQLQAYYESVRQAEKDLADAQAWIDRPKPEIDADQPADIINRAQFIQRAQLLINLVPLIIQTDSTRVVSIMIQDHGTVPVIEGVSGEHHNLSHHGQDTAKIEQLKKIEAGIVSCFADLLTQMKNKSEAGSSLLDNTNILFGSNLGNANSHDATNLPIFLAGGGHKHGKYIAHQPSDNVPLSNMFVKMLNDMNLETDSFGQSSGELTV